MNDQIFSKKKISYIQILLFFLMLAWVLFFIKDLKSLLNPISIEKDLLFKVTYIIFFVTNLIAFVLIFMIFSQIKINPFSMKVVSLLKWTSLVFFTISATTVFIDTYRGIDGMFTFMGLTIGVVSLLFFILCFSTLILGDILTEIVRIKDESDYII